MISKNTTSIIGVMFAEAEVRSEARGTFMFVHCSRYRGSIGLVAVGTTLGFSARRAVLRRLMGDNA